MKRARPSVATTPLAHRTLAGAHRLDAPIPHEPWTRCTSSRIPCSS